MTTIDNAAIEARSQIVAAVRDFTKNEVAPTAMKYEKDARYPHELVDQMKEMGLFGLNIPAEFGGLGLDSTTFATIFEEIAKGWMALCGVLGSHHIMTYLVAEFGTSEQQKRLLPSMARGEIRGGLALTEPDAGSDVQSIQTSAVLNSDEYVINGNKMFITNGLHADAIAVLAVTDGSATPRSNGMSCFIAHRGPGFSVGRELDKLGYRGVDTCELSFEGYRCKATDLIGGKEGEGFKQVMSALEGGRINVAARAVGIATAAFEASIKYAQERRTFGKPIAQHQAIQLLLADMATKIQAARLLTYEAARKKDLGERVDLEAGMAKLFASEACQQVTLDAMRIHGGYGYIKDLPVERYYRDAPLMLIGEGTNEIQKTIIARQLLRRHVV